MPTPSIKLIIVSALAIAAALALLLMPGCDLMSRTLSMHITDYRQFSGDSIQTIFQEQSGLKIIEAENEAGLSPLEHVAQGKADLALVENSSTFKSGVRAVLPVFESVLHVLVRDDFEPQDENSPLRGASIYIANNSSAGANFVSLVTQRQGLSALDYSVVLKPQADRPDVIIYFGAINPTNLTWAPQGYSLVSLDNSLNPKRQFYEEGIGYTAPNMKPKVIPTLTYDLPGNENPILTVAVDTLLVAGKNVPELLIYKLTRTFLEQKPRFTALAPHLFSGINESFDPLSLNFPLHRGSRLYLERDEPGFLERYAETINMLVYVTFLLISAFLAIGRGRARMKKDRIDVFYERVMVIADQKHEASCEQLLQQLDALEREAFNSLIKEKLAANESFRIFTDLMARTRAELKEQKQFGEKSP
jgi:TRAP-type uncharacterized transport system substrate-binding protein